MPNAPVWMTGVEAIKEASGISDRKAEVFTKKEFCILPYLTRNIESIRRKI